MKNTKAVLKESISLIDEIFKSSYRKNSIGIFTTGIGITITVLGINILLSKPDNAKSTENTIEPNEINN